MAKTDVKLYSTDTYGKVTTTTISDVNPAATSSQLVQMGHLFNNLTQNTYGKTDRINTINCDTESGDSKQTPTLYLATSSGSSISSETRTVDANTFDSYVVHYDGDGEIVIESTPATATFLVNIGDFDETTHNAPMTAYLKATANQQYADFTLHATETDTYKAAQANTIRFIASNV